MRLNNKKGDARNISIHRNILSVFAVVEAIAGHTNEQNNSLTAILEESLDLYISFDAPVDHQHIGKLIGGILKKKPKNIFLSICTNGGQATEVIRFFSCIQENDINLTTYNSSFANSAGLLLFLCGRERICTPYSLFMTREQNMTLSGNFDSIRENIDLNEASARINSSFAQDRCGIEEKEWDRWHSASIYGVTAKEALKNNVATKIDFLRIPEKNKETFDVAGPEFLEKKIGNCTSLNLPNFSLSRHHLAN